MTEATRKAHNELVFAICTYACDTQDGIGDWEPVRAAIDTLIGSATDSSQRSELVNGQERSAKENLQPLSSSHPQETTDMEAARLRAYRAMRLFEPSMEGYNAAVAVYEAAFGVAAPLVEDGATPTREWLLKRVQWLSDQLDCNQRANPRFVVEDGAVTCPACFAKAPCPSHVCEHPACSRKEWE